jgi:hypothetical protein
MKSAILTCGGSNRPDSASGKLAWRGWTVRGNRGEAIGKIEEIYVADETAAPDWALVRGDGPGDSTGKLLRARWEPLVLESSSQNAGHQPPDGRAQETARRSPEEQTRVQATPVALTSPEDYALLATVFLTGLGSVIALARRRHAEGAAAIPPRDLPALALATFALADTVAKEKVSTWLRQPFVEEDSDHHPLSPKGHGMQRAVGELLTCMRCAGTWGALVLVGLRYVASCSRHTASRRSARSC